ITAETSAASAMPARNQRSPPELHRVAASSAIAGMYAGDGQFGSTRCRVALYTKNPKQRTDTTPRLNAALLARAPSARPQAMAIITNRMGDASPAWPPKKSPSCRHAARSAEPRGADNPCRSWWTTEIQPCCAFHTSTGEKTISATIAATYGPGSRKRARKSGRNDIATATPTGTKIDVYFDTNAAPSAIPAATHHRSAAAEAGAWRSARTTQ